MNRLSAVEVIIIVILAVILSPLAFLSINPAVTEHAQAIDWNNATESITFDLKAGQTVTGSFSTYLPSFTQYEASYYIYSDNLTITGWRSTSKGGDGSFNFTAPASDLYYLRIFQDQPFTIYMDYSYSVTPEPIFGIQPVQLMLAVLIIGAILVSTIEVNKRKKRAVTRQLRVAASV